MTWVIGGSSIFGYGMLLSDVRVTFGDSSEKDIVQKAYGLGPYIVGGFAGSVRLGFQLLESLGQLLVVPPGVTEPGAYEPVEVVQHWQATAADVFAKTDKVEQAAHSHILLVGISHEIDPKTAQIPNAVHRPRAFIIKMMSPFFEPIITRRPQ